MKSRVSPATVLAGLALFFSLGGAGMAAAGYRITSIWQIAPKVRHALRGHTGPQGPQGIQGPRGLPGTPGATGDPGTPGSSASLALLTFTSGAQAISSQQQTSIRALCPSNHAISGGYQVDPGIQVLADGPVTQDDGQPYPRPVGWTITVNNPTGSALNATVSVNCAF